MPVHRYPIRVYFEDTDAGGVAYHANYLRWAERARTESLRDIGLPHHLLMERHASLLVVRRIEVAYLRPARLDDLVFIESRVIKAGSASVDVGQDVVAEDGTVLARLKVGLVCVSQESLRPVPLPEPWRSALRPDAAAGAEAGG
ncbi:YbgC/FadM family acyl-CoA thioesterase [Roseomonas sp. SSH11]|uniref:YbgC/FadM family acyl-CoA thioesterase n=1 Tax=Pararoseomonas baculiformis TaxID=2820812 RepID=A0ABS4AGN3_9PROT|nr:YbgC/FadM family acyl-CoA thioesterase [Pararoseomonas baculiformis]MBP0446190.1 YbgC/FadM family acyl-CoA thioesterase [Pararoseomonas baculiformis]